ncbi:uncharacterized protein [Amphiura filiformis]|uniref:uncharacterized protein n=1 Tax=Amphiura filiformis TaxID=82378 RepID=UPI003B225814
MESKDTINPQVQEVMSKVKLNENHLSQNEMSEITGLISDYVDIFQVDGGPLGNYSGIKHEIHTDSPPVRSRPYRHAPHVQAEVRRQVDVMLDQGVIRESTSPWSFPVCMIPKPGTNTWRFCIDFRKLNNLEPRQNWPIAHIHDALDSLGSNEPKYFTTLDLASGYWQIGLEEQSKPKTAFITQDGLYEFNVMPFGLHNAPATFQRAMQEVLRGLNWKFVFCYLDDVIIFSRSFEEHLDHLKQVFDRLREAGLKLQPKKCTFGQTEVKYLGHIVSKDGIATDPAKLQIVKDYPTPTKVSETEWEKSDFDDMADDVLQVPQNPQVHPQVDAIRNLRFNHGKRMKIDDETAAQKAPSIPSDIDLGKFKEALLTDGFASSMLAYLDHDELPKDAEILFYNHCTRWPILVPLKETDASTVARVFFDYVICEHGCPNSLLSDRGTNFLSKVVLEVCRIMRTQKLNTSSYHPQCNAIQERYNAVILDTISHYVNQFHNDWDRYLSAIQFAYRTTPATNSVGFSPFFLLYGREARLPIDVTLLKECQYPDKTLRDHIHVLISQLEVFRAVSKSHAEEHQANMKDRYDERSHEVEYQIGDTVWIYIPALQKGLSRKLMKFWSGPYLLVEKTGPVNF